MKPKIIHLIIPVIPQGIELKMSNKYAASSETLKQSVNQISSNHISFHRTESNQNKTYYIPNQLH